jgi:hypothetical protein
MNIEEAANEYEKVNTGIYPEVGQTSIRDAFIDGAKWQKEQDEMSRINYEGARATYDNTVQHLQEKIDEKYELGKMAMKEQMMKEAVEGVVTNAGGEFGCDVATFRFDDNHTYSILLPHEEKRKYGDKVRIIVVKEDN